MGGTEVILGMLLLLAGMGAMFSTDVSDDDSQIDAPDEEYTPPDEPGLEPISL